MSRIKGKDTGPERIVRTELHRRGVRFRKHVKELSGKPDIVFTKRMVAVFVDGDFWHGYRFPAWEHTVSEFWRQKILRTRKRDAENFRKLRSLGWQVVRLWQHDIERDIEGSIARIIAALEKKCVDR